MTDDSYSMPIWIGIGIGIRISNFFSTLYLILRVLENNSNGLPLVTYMVTCILACTTVTGLAVLRMYIWDAQYTYVHTI